MAAVSSGPLGQMKRAVEKTCDAGWPISTGVSKETVQGSGVMADEAQSPKSDDADESNHNKSVFRRFRPLFLLLAFVAVLPSILTMLQWHKIALNMAAPKLASAITYDSITTHWWSSVRLTNVSVTEVLPTESEIPTSESGPQQVLTAKSMVSDQSLWTLLFSMGRNATFTINEPVVSVRSVGTTTNLEATLTEIFGEASSNKKSDAFPVAVTVNNGTIRLLKPSDGSRPADFVAVSDINGTFSSLDNSVLLPEISLTANILAPSESTSLASGRTKSVNPRIAANLDQLNTDFPLIPFEPNQLVEMDQTEGRQSIQIQLMKDEDQPGVHHLSVELSRLQLEDIRPIVSRMIPGLTLEGQVSCMMQAHVLRNKNDSGFGGRLQFSGSKFFARHTSWHETEAIRLETVTAGGVVAMADDGVLVKDLTVRSPLLNISGNGQVKVAPVDPVKALRKAADRTKGIDTTAQTEAEALSAGEVTVNGQLDLAELCRMLPRTIQLVDGLQVEKADVDFSCRIRQQPSEMLSRQLSGPARPGFQWQLATESSELRARQNGQRLQLKAPLRIDAMGPLTMDSVSLRKARLSGDFGELAIDPIDQGFAIKGNLNPEQLHQNLSQLVVLPPIGLTGNVQTEGTVQWMPDGTIKATAIHLEGDDLLVTSPQLKIHPSASALKMLSGQLQVKTQTSTVRTLLAPWHDASWLGSASQLQAVVDCQPDAINVQALIEPLSTGYSPSSSNMAYGSAGFQIEHARVKAKLIADSTGAVYDIRQGSIELPGLQADVTGKLALVQDLVFADLTANTQYDLAVLLNNVLEVDPSLLTLQGRQSQPISIQGCLSAWSTDELNRQLSTELSTKDRSRLLPLSISGSVRWDSGQLMGLPVSSGTVNATLNEGLLRTEPIACNIGSGSLNAMVQYDLNTDRIQLAPGSRLQNLELTEQFTKQWLGYAMPMMGDAAEIRGHVSCRVENCNYDLSNANNSQIYGTIEIHDARAITGPSANSLLSAIALLDQDASQNFKELNLPAQTVRFQMQDGQIAHDKLLIQLGKYEITSRGFVTVDQRLNVSLTVPVSESASRFTGARTVTIPVTGTVSRPTPDTRGLLQNIGQQQIQNRVNDELDKGLNRLFDKLR